MLHQWSQQCGVYQDIICCKNTLYGFYRSYSLRIWFDAWDLQGCFHQLPPKERKSIIASSIGMPILGRRSNCTNYLVESKGEVLLVQRSHVNHQSLFGVYKLDLECQTLTKVDSLGDTSVLIDQYQSVSMSTQDLQNFEVNSIYFIEDSAENRRGVMYSFEDGKKSFLPEFY